VLKIGDLVKHSPWKDDKSRWLNQEFQTGLIIEMREVQTETHFLIAYSNKTSWYRQTEIEKIDKKKKIQLSITK